MANGAAHLRLSHSSIGAICVHHVFAAASTTAKAGEWCRLPASSQVRSSSSVALAHHLVSSGHGSIPVPLASRGGGTIGRTRRR